jgi:hypothetical protein
MPSIDTLVVFDHLKQAFSEDQAHILSQVLSKVWEAAEAETTATKKDIKELEAALKKDTLALELQISEVDSNLQLKIAETNTLIAQTKADILKWMVGFLLAQTGVIAALVKLL